MSTHRTIRTLGPAAVAVAVVIAGFTLAPSPADAAVLFSDDFEQPTSNIWQIGSGASWSVVTEDGSKVYRQSNTAGLPYAPYAQAGSGSGAGTAVTARVKPNTALSATSLVGVAGRMSDPNNLYYVAFRGSRLEIGQQSWGTNVPLASTPFAATAGGWYTLTLSFATAGTVTGSVSGPGGSTATVSAADPGGPKAGDHVGFWMYGASASYDDIKLTDANPAPPTPTSPPACPVAIAIRIGVNYGTIFTATLTFQNLTAAPISPSWTIKWRFADGQFIQSAFNATWNQVGPIVTITSPVWFPAVAPGAVSNPPVGFQATVPGAGHPPVDVAFNGAPCAITFS